MGFWDKIVRTFGKDRLWELTTQSVMNQPIYPDNQNGTYLSGYTGNGNVFSVINKIVEPMSRVPIVQIDARGNEKPGRAMDVISNPNPFMSQAEFLEAVFTFYEIFGNGYIAASRPEYGIYAGRVRRLDVLPPQWTEIVAGDWQNPVQGYRLLKYSKIDYPFGDVLHWKDFNPDYQETGSHLYGMSRLKPLLQAITANQSAWDSMVAAFQNQGAYGVLTILGVREDDGKISGRPTTREQISKMTSDWRRKWSGDAKRGELAVTNKSVEWVPFGLSVQDLSILQSIPLSRGVLCDAYNVSDILFAGSEGRTYDNYNDAQKALWQCTIIPTLDGFLEKLSQWLLPLCGETGSLIANYDNINVLQSDKSKMVDWMVRARLTPNEIREALGYGPLSLPNMDVPLASFGEVRIDELGIRPLQDTTEKMLKRIGMEDYREV